MCCSHFGDSTILRASLTMYIIRYSRLKTLWAVLSLYCFIKKIVHWQLEALSYYEEVFHRACMKYQPVYALIRLRNAVINITELEDKIHFIIATRRNIPTSKRSIAPLPDKNWISFIKF